MSSEFVLCLHFYAKLFLFLHLNDMGGINNLKPTVQHTGNKTIVHYPTNSNGKKSNVNRPSQVIRDSKGTTCIYKK